MFTEKTGRKHYVSPVVGKTPVLAESGFLVVASNEKTTIKSDSTIEVEEYDSFENDVTFE